MKKRKSTSRPKKGHSKLKHQPKNKAIKSNFYNLPGLGIVLILGIIIYSNSFDCAFQLDDRESIIENIAIRDLSNLKDIWNHNNSRFIAYYTFAINYHFGGLNLWGYHFGNLLIHLINASLVYWLTLLILSSPVLKKKTISKDKKIIAFITALLFVSHPLATQSVTYIVQRMASMVTLFYLLSLALYVKARLADKSNLLNYLFFVGALISAILALLTKENAFTLPFTIILFEIIFFKSRKRSMSIKDYRVIALVLVLLCFILIVISNFSFRIFNTIPPDPQNNFTEITPINYLFTQFSVIVKYIQLLILPINQNVDYDFRISNSFFEIRTILSFLFLLSLIILAIFQYKKNRIITFGIFWFFLTLSVESSIIPISDVIFDHRTYLPSFGYFIILSSVIYGLLWKKHKNIAIAILVIIIGSNAFMTYERNKVWKSELTFWNDIIAKSPNKPRPYNNRGKTFLDLNRPDKALNDYSKAIELQPAYSGAYNNRGYIYSNQERYKEAIDDFSKAIELKPTNANAYYNRGLVFMKQGKYDSAIEDYTKAIGLNSTYTDAYYNRGLVFRYEENYENALENFNKAIELNPNFIMAYSARGEVYIQLKKYSEGIPDFNKAIELNPNFAAAYVNRGVAELKLGNMEKSCQDFKRAIELGNKRVEALYKQNCE
jgi:tetratricopeptide (TPR) repeat protein